MERKHYWMEKAITDKAADFLDKAFLGGTLFSLDKLLNTLAAAAPLFKKELEKHDTTVLLKLRDNSRGRLLVFRGGVVRGKNGADAKAEVEMVFEDEGTARRVMSGQMTGNTAPFVAAAKNGSMVLNGPDEEAMWFSSLLLKVFSFDVLYLNNYGTKMANGETRCVTGDERRAAVCLCKGRKDRPRHADRF